MKLAAVCLEEFGSVDNDTPTRFTYCIKIEEVAKILEHIHRNHSNHLDSISLVESITNNEREFRNMAIQIQDGFNVLVRHAIIEQFFSGDFKCENVRHIDEGFEDGI